MINYKEKLSKIRAFVFDFDGSRTAMLCNMP